MPLSVIRQGRSPAKAWLPSDRMLAVAFQIHEDSVCAGCGGYRDECWDGRGDWQEQVTVCARCAVLERHRSDDEQLPAGAKVMVESVTVASLAPGELAPQFA